MGASVGSGAHLGLAISLCMVTWQLLPVVVVGVEPWLKVSVCERRGWELGVVTHLGCCDVALAAVAGPKRWWGGGGKKEPTWEYSRNFEPKHHVGNSTRSRGVGVLTNLEQIL